eukprot:5877301-Pyramimonas_sp.AAC.1
MLTEQGRLRFKKAVTSEHCQRRDDEGFSTDHLTPNLTRSRSRSTVNETEPLPEGECLARLRVGVAWLLGARGVPR